MDTEPLDTTQPKDTRDASGVLEHRGLLRKSPALTGWVEWPQPESTYFFARAPGTFFLIAGTGTEVHFDLEGRVRRVAADGRHYLRGLDGRVVRTVVSRSRAPVAPPGPFSNREAAGVFRRAHESVLAALETLPDASGVLAPHRSGDGALRHARECLTLAAEITPERLAAESDRFRAAYDPLGVLPPDSYRTLILQATVGCRYGGCTFCTIYDRTAYRQKSLPEFRRHVQRVKEFLGRAIELRSGVFLGEANALELPTDTLLEMLQLAREEVPVVVAEQTGRRGGFSAFTDTFQAERHSASGLARLRAAGLRRVYLGIESGDDVVLTKLRKPADGARVRERVARLKEAGISVGAIFLVGAGGKERSREHVEGTVSLVRDLPLDKGDIIYLSRLESTSGESAGGSRGPLSSEELAIQETELLSRLRDLGRRTSRYDLRSFVYY